MDSFFWHDYETWGVNPAYDWPSQFAGVRTSMDLEIIGDPVNIQCRLPEDYVPSLGAAQVTGLLPQDVNREGLREYQFFAAIHAQLAQAGTCGVGYNSIRFDDEVTRYGLYRNFYDPYGREWQSGCSRWDIVDMVRLCYAVRPEGLEWPMREDEQGRTVPSLRLEKISELNGIEHQHAHDALSDVYATIEVARKIRQLHPRLYDYALAMRDKRRVNEELQLGSGEMRLHISSRFGAIHSSASMIYPLCVDLRNKNEIHCIDLRYSPEPLLQLSAEELNELRFTSIDQLPQGIERIPLKSVHLNRSPIVVTPKLVDETVASRCKIDLKQCEEHRQMLLAAPDLADKIRAMSGLKTFDRENTLVEAKLYEGFIDRQDRLQCQRITALDGHALSQEEFAFNDQRLAPLLFSYRGRNFPETFDEDEKQQWSEYVRDRLLIDQGERLEDELANCDQAIKSTQTQADQDFISGFKSYLDQLKHSVSERSQS